MSAKACKHCGAMKYGRHAGNSYCRAAQAEKRARAKGLVPIRGAARRPPFAIKLPFHNFQPSPTEPRDFRTTSRGAASALGVLGLPVRRFKTWPGQLCGGGKIAVTPESWTTPAACRTLDVVQDVAIRFLRCSLPEAARRLTAHRELFAEYDARRRLGEDSEALDALLKPLRHVPYVKRINLTNAQLRRMARRA